MAEKTGMKVAKAKPEDVDQMREFLFKLEEMISDLEDIDDGDIGAFCRMNFPAECGRHFQRILFGYDTLVENACDPTLSYLDWKPEIKEAITAFQQHVQRTGDNAPRCVRCGNTADVHPSGACHVFVASR